jgi:hypothetical protein
MTRCFIACDTLVEMIARTLLCLFLLGACGQVVDKNYNQNVCTVPDQISCSGTCLDVSADPLNCGDCGMTCGATATCGNSQCNACPGAQIACSNSCVDAQTDPNNCGMCGKSCGAGGMCSAGTCITGYYALTGTPSPATVFNVIELTYKFPNNLANSIWQRESNMIVTGEFNQPGYWAFAAGSTGYVVTPDRDTGTGLHSRMVLVPVTDSVIYTVQPNPNSSGPSLPGQLMIATISRTTGLLSDPQVAVFSDGHAAGCQLHSASATQFLCLTNNTIRRYATTKGSATLSYVDTITLSMPVPTAGICGTCFGGVFAFDGAYFYFSSAATGNTNLVYSVYEANGTYNNVYTATGAASINSVYFDWSVGRYSTHDGYGGRSGGTVYTTSAPANDSDTHTFSAISTTHTAR